jgi:ubiquitin carboxyl-terminal hydrolase 4/11/15
LTHPIQSPKERLDLAKFKSDINETKHTIYDLIATSNHFGGLGGGHYTSSTKSWDGNYWLDRNDSQVTKLDSSSALDLKAIYVLFYERKSSI